MHSYRPESYLRFYNLPHASTASPPNAVRELSLSLLTHLHATSIYQAPSSPLPFSAASVWVLETIAFALKLLHLGPTLEAERLLSDRLHYIDELLQNKSAFSAAFHEELRSSRLTMQRSLPLIKREIVPTNIAHAPPLLKFLSACEDITILCISFLGICVNPGVPGSMSDFAERARKTFECDFPLNPKGYEWPEDLLCDPWLMPLVGLVRSPAFLAITGRISLDRAFQTIEQHAENNNKNHKNNKENKKNKTDYDDGDGGGDGDKVGQNGRSSSGSGGIRSGVVKHLRHLVKAQRSTDSIGIIRPISCDLVDLYAALVTLLHGVALELLRLHRFLKVMNDASRQLKSKKTIAHQMTAKRRCHALASLIEATCLGVEAIVKLHKLKTFAPTTTSKKDHKECLFSWDSMTEIAAGVKFRFKRIDKSLDNLYSSFRVCANELGEHDYANTYVYTTDPGSQRTDNPRDLIESVQTANAYIRKQFGRISLELRAMKESGSKRPGSSYEDRKRQRLRAISTATANTSEEEAKQERVVVTIFENQRLRGMVKGWSSDGLDDNTDPPPFSDKSGTLSLDKRFFSLPEGWRWESEWRVATSSSTTGANVGDDHGWRYNETFSSQKLWSKRKFSKAKVRQRIWERVRLKMLQPTGGGRDRNSRKNKHGQQPVRINALTTEEQEILGKVQSLYNEILTQQNKYTRPGSFSDPINLFPPSSAYSPQSGGGGGGSSRPLSPPNNGVSPKASPGSKRSSPKRNTSSPKFMLSPAKSPKSTRKTPKISTSQYTTSYWLRRIALPPAPLLSSSSLCDHALQREIKRGVLPIIDSVTRFQRQRLALASGMRGSFRPISDAIDWVLVQVCSALVLSCSCSSSASTSSASTSSAETKPGQARNNMASGVSLLMKGSQLSKFLHAVEHLFSYVFSSLILKARKQLPASFRVIKTIKANDVVQLNEHGEHNTVTTPSAIASVTRFKSSLEIRRPWEGEWSSAEVEVVCNPVRCKDTGSIHRIDFLVWRHTNTNAARHAGRQEQEEEEGKSKQDSEAKAKETKNNDSNNKNKRRESQSIIIKRDQIYIDPVCDSTFVVESGFSILLFRARTDEERKHWIDILDSSASNNDKVFEGSLDETILSSMPHMTTNNTANHSTKTKLRTSKNSSSSSSKMTTTAIEKVPGKWHRLNDFCFLQDLSSRLERDYISMCAAADRGLVFLQGNTSVRLLAATRVLLNTGFIFASAILANRRLRIRARSVQCEIVQDFDEKQAEEQEQTRKQEEQARHVRLERCCATALRESEAWKWVFRSVDFDSESAERAFDQDNIFMTYTKSGQKLAVPIAHARYRDVSGQRKSSSSISESEWSKTKLHDFVGTLGVAPLLAIRRMVWLFGILHTFCRFGVLLERMIMAVEHGDLRTSVLLVGAKFPSLLKKVAMAARDIGVLCQSMTQDGEIALQRARRRGSHIIDRPHRHWVANFQMSSRIRHKVHDSANDFHVLATNLLSALQTDSTTAKDNPTTMPTLVEPKSSSKPKNPISRLIFDTYKAGFQFGIDLPSRERLREELLCDLPDDDMLEAQEEKLREYETTRAVELGLTIRLVERVYFPNCKDLSYWSKQTLPEDPPACSTIRHATRVPITGKLRLIRPPEGCEWHGEWKPIQPGWTYRLPGGRKSSTYIKGVTELRFIEWMRPCRLSSSVPCRLSSSVAGTRQDSSSTRESRLLSRRISRSSLITPTPRRRTQTVPRSRSIVVVAQIGKVIVCALSSAPY